MRLPNAERALVDDAKLRDYCLSPTHPVGRHKAIVFRHALGFGPADVSRLRGLLLGAARTGNVLMGEHDGYGQRYQLDFSVGAPDIGMFIRSVWIVRAEEDFPRLVTCYVLAK